MKLISFREIFSGAVNNCRRFPFVIANTLLGVTSALILIDYEGPQKSSILFNIMYASLPGLPLLLALALTAERRKLSKWTSLGIQSAGVLLLVVYGSILPSYLIEEPAIELNRLLMVTLALCFLLTYLPYAGKGGSINGFWHYNKTLVFRAILSNLYSLVLFIGLTLAMQAVNNLFGLEIQPKRYSELAVLIFGFVNVMIFLNGIPDDLDALDSATEYPKALKVFVQYVLIPLAAVYAVIIYAYTAKIIVTWTWPDGWISRMILGYAVPGLLTLLILYPVRSKEENAWMRKISNAFFISIIPLLVLYPLALFRRISQYGFTESRYIAVALAVWLPLIILYFIMAKKWNIKILPLSLGIISLLVSVGPWGMFYVSEQSQSRRLEQILNDKKILVDGKIRQSSEQVTLKDKINISSIVGYLYATHGYGTIQHWFGAPVDSVVADGLKKNKQPEQVVKMLGVEYVLVWEGGMSNTMTLNPAQDAALPIEGYRLLIRSQFFNSDNKEKKYPAMHLVCGASQNLDTLAFFYDSGDGKDTVRFDMITFARKLHDEYGDVHLGNIAQEKMTLTQSGRQLNIRLFLRSLQTQNYENDLRINYYSLDAAFAEK